MVRCAFVVVALALTLVGMGCAGSEAAPEATQERPEPTTRTRERSDKDRQVDLRVDAGSWGVFAFADVFINGRGPFTFTVDTGASNSVVDWDLVQKLGIKTIGKPLTVTGITCRGQAARIRMSEWQVGDVPLPAKEIRAIDMPAQGVDGLLGSDVLSTFGSITVDYGGARLLLPSKS